MNTKTALLGLIVVTTTLFTAIYGILDVYLVAVFSLALGLIWLLLELYDHESASTVFFLLFVGLAIMASLSGIPLPITLLGFSTNLAAWDLSLFRARVAGENGSEARIILEKRHLQKLAVTASVGFLLALPPAFIKISVDFVVVFFVMCLIMLALKSSATYLR